MSRTHQEWAAKVRAGHTRCESCKDPPPSVPGIPASTFLEAAHVVPHRHGGKLVTENGLALCRRCHGYLDFLIKLTRDERNPSAYHGPRTRAEALGLLTALRNGTLYRHSVAGWRTAVRTAINRSAGTHAGRPRARA